MPKSGKKCHFRQKVPKKALLEASGGVISAPRGAPPEKGGVLAPPGDGRHLTDFVTK